MSLRQRIIKSEKELPALKSRKKLDPLISWIIEHNYEFRECFKQLHRLKWKAEKDIH